jgi:hypothetical protein
MCSAQCGDNIGLGWKKCDGRVVFFPWKSVSNDELCHNCHISPDAKAYISPYAVSDTIPDVSPDAADTIPDASPYNVQRAMRR